MNRSRHLFLHDDDHNQNYDNNIFVLRPIKSKCDDLTQFVRICGMIKWKNHDSLQYLHVTGVIKSRVSTHNIPRGYAFL